MNKKYIDADEFVKEINDRIDAAFKWGENAIADNDEEIKTRAEQAVATFCEAILTAMKMPDANVVKIRRGEWKKDSDVPFFWKCSECGAYLFWRKEEYLLRDTDEPNYCPNCGVLMVDEEEDIPMEYFENGGI